MSKYLPPEVVAEIRKAKQENAGTDIPSRAFTVSEYYDEINKDREEMGLANLTKRACFTRLHKLADGDPQWHKGQRFKGHKWYFWCEKEGDHSEGE